MGRLNWVGPGLVLITAAVVAEDGARSDVGLTFESHIRPIFRTYCLDCHGAEAELEGSLDLRLRRFLVKGGDSGPAIEPGNRDGSFLYRRVRDGEMPPRDKKPSAEEVATIGAWIAAGSPTAREEPEQITRGLRITPEDRSFWSFQPIRRHAVPTIDGGERVRTPVDAFVLAAMRAAGLTFAPDPDKVTLLRRATIDLTGLPPTLDEMVEFLADESPGAYERVVDRLLESRHYGERWARHWLDVAGYADSEGYTTRDAVRNFAYKYRDYVIRSFNADKPFDRFVVEQLAGDELVSSPDDQLTANDIDRLTATGFLRMAEDGTGSGSSDDEAARNDVIADTLKIVSTALLGLTVGCAQCHDHRHDPLLQMDYYRLRAVFEPAYDWKNWRVPSQRRISLYTKADRARAVAIDAEAGKVAAERSKKQSEYVAAALEKELEKFEESRRDTIRTAYFTPGDKRTPEQKKIFEENPFLKLHGGNLYQYNQKAADELKEYDAKMVSIRARKPFEDFLRVLTEVPGKVPVTYLFHRGDRKRPKDPVAPGGLTIAAPEGQRFDIAENDPNLPTTGRRLAYARSLTDGRHPLVGRVIVNRVWMHHFGRGLVNTPSDFGTVGARPTHPKLLDWLASEFTRQGWSLKWLHRLIMTSTAYRQSAATDPEKESIDPENRLYWRKPLQRLEAEIIRDRILATSGQLNARMFGPPIPVVENEVGQIVVAKKDAAGGQEPHQDEQRFRRSIYIQVRRSLPMSLMRQFDMPVMEVNCEKRSFSTLATQSLMLMNGEFVLEQAEYFAKRLLREAGDDRRRQVARAWQLALSRPATAVEMQRSLAFLQWQIKQLRAAARVAAGDSAPVPDGEAKKKEVRAGGKAKEGESGPTTPQLQALTNLCQTLFGASEFLYVD